jgi:hypothetical protein
MAASITAPAKPRQPLAVMDRLSKLRRPIKQLNMARSKFRLADGKLRGTRQWVADAPHGVQYGRAVEFGLRPTEFPPHILFAVLIYIDSKYRFQFNTVIRGIC